MTKPSSISIFRIPKSTANVEYYETNGCILNVLRENYSDEEINSMSINEIFEAWCEWEGLLGYATKIKKIIRNIYEIDLDTLSEIKKEV